ncbi:MAG: sigma-70 family RNA polymerase sigma factor [Kiritimatiellae bacterium]|nr:sigma-70 family RNA polymerase sigma factor [Kiritimatiellia bacterium]
MEAIDQQLIETYVRDKSEGAFRQIVERYGQLVYSAAYRRLQDHHLAEDASQATFIILARKAHRLGAKTMLGGWLWRTATFCARNLARQRVTREAREREIAPAEADGGEPAWTRFAPQLDAALLALSAKTREALVAHYLLGKPRQEAAEALGCPVNTLNKRIQKGLARLRGALMRRGVAVSSAVLAAGLTERTAEAVSGAALDSMHSVAFGTLTGATALSSTPYVLAKGVLRMMAWTRVKLTAAYAGGALALLGVTAALAAGLMTAEYRMTEEPHYAPLEIPREIQEGWAGYILDFYPDSWSQLDLNGTWKLKVFQIEEGSRWSVEDAGLTDRYYDPAFSTDGWKDIPVPYSLGEHEAATPRKGRYWRGIAWYRRTFTIPPEWAGQLTANWRVLLRFEALESAGDAWVNGQPIGGNMDGPGAHEFDITDKVRAQDENVLAVRVVGGGTDYRGRKTDGLWQPVRLVCVPPTRAVRTRMATSIDPPSLLIKTTIQHYGDAGECRLEARLAPWNVKGATAQTIPLGLVALQPGENEATFRFRTPGVRLWSPDEPNLYLLSIHEGRTELFRERIGFRMFEAKDGNFHLNGHKIKLMGLGAGGLKNQKPSGSWCCNHENYMRKTLWGIKQANINFMRPHGGNIPATMYNLCDELGLMIYDESNKAHSSLYDPEKLERQGKAYTRWILQVHNRASCVLWDFGGNEIYSQDMEMIPVLNYFYSLVEGLDLQRRPKTSSSGRLTWERLERFPELEKADFADSHDYDGYYFGSYQEWIAGFERHDRAAKKRYGNVPTLNCEWGFPGDTARYRGNTPELGALYKKQPWGKDEKREWIRWALAEQAETGGYLRTKANWAGGRIWSTDPVRLWAMKAELAKRFLEVYRRSGDVIDGGHFNSGVGDLLIRGWSGLDSGLRYLGLASPIDRSKKGAFYKTPSFYVWRRVYNPTFICLDIYDKNTFAGQLWKSTVYLMNDSQKDHGAAHAVIEVRGPDGQPFHRERVWQGALTPYLRRTVDIQIPLPSALPTSTCRLELFLADARGVPLSDNRYPLHVVNRQQLLGRLPPKGKVGLYEVFADNGKRPDRTTEGILTSLGVPFKAVRNFAELAALDTLIIAPKSLDMNVAENGGAIAEWVRGGGRLLCFKQDKAGQLPFLPEVSVLPGKSGTFTEVLVPDHPIFAGLAQAHFDDWNGHKGLLYWNTLTPLNEGILSAGPTTRFGNDNLKMISASYAVGKGEIVLSQYELTRRYGTDSIATRFTQNLLAYVLTQPRSELSLPFESTATAKARIHLPKSQAHYVDLRAAANGDLREFSNLPAGISTLSGDVPFQLINPTENGGRACIELRGKQRPDAPAATAAIPIGCKLKSLYVLHYATYAHGLAEGEVVYTVRIRYADGREQVIPMRNRLEVGDWWKAADLAGANVVFTEGNMNAFLTEIKLPAGVPAVDSLRIESASKANPVILAVTGRTTAEAL